MCTTVLSLLSPWSSEFGILLGLLSPAPEKSTPEDDFCRWGNEFPRSEAVSCASSGQRKTKSSLDRTNGWEYWLSLICIILKSWYLFIAWVLLLLLLVLLLLVSCHTGFRRLSLENYTIDARKLFNMDKERKESRLINAFISLYSLQ